MAEYPGEKCSSLYAEKNTTVPTHVRLRFGIGLELGSGLGLVFRLASGLV